MAETTKEALAKWDAGETVWSIEMGGLGPGYEQCIQILIWELVRDAEPLPTEDADGKVSLWNWGDATVTRCDASVGGFSGAQVGAAKGVAARILKNGYAATIATIPEDRKIQVSKRWPQPPARAEGQP